MQGFLNSLHFGTRFLLIFMVVVYLIQLLFLDPRIESLLIFCPQKIIEDFQFWRLITGAFMHAGILHLCMNMLSFIQLGLTFESKVGTLSYFFHIIVFGLIESLIHTFIAWIMKLGGDNAAWYSSAVGFSGVLFALIIVDNTINENQTRSVLGLFMVNAQLYPWIMLLIMSLLIPNASFLGHLSGVIAGYLYQFRILRFITPSPSFFSSIERKLCCCCINHLGYLPVEGTGEGRPWAIFNNGTNDNDQTETTTTQRHDFNGHGRTIGTNNNERNEASPNINQTNIPNRPTTTQINGESHEEDTLDNMTIQLSDLDNNDKSDP